MNSVMYPFKSVDPAIRTCLLPNEEKLKGIFPDAKAVYRNVVSMSLLGSCS